MQLGLIGLGRMGANPTRRLTRGDGHEVVVIDVNEFGGRVEKAAAGAR